MRVVIDDHAAVAYSGDINAAFITKDGPFPTIAKIDDEIETSGYNKIIPWGINNRKPQEIIECAKSNTIIPSALDWKARALYSGGLVYGEVDGFDEDGNEKLKPIYDVNIDLFIRRNRRYLSQASKAFYWFKNIFPEMILTKNRKEIYCLTSQRPEYCRYGQQDAIGQLNKIYINANWGDAKEDENSEEFTNPVSMLDPYYDLAGQLKNGNQYKYILPVNDPSPGTSFYQSAEWYSAIESGWLDVAKEIPKFKKTLFKNQITIKYLFEVSTWWWNWKYPGFDQFNTKKKQEKMKEELERFVEFMKGSAGSGNSIMTTFNSDPDLQKDYPGWKITAIDNKIKDGIYIEDSNEASSHILYALGVDGTLIGSTPGSKLGAGSGSDKNAAFKIYYSLAKPHQDLILEPFELAAEYNGWTRKYPRLKFWFANVWRSIKSKDKEEKQQSA